MNTDQTRPLFCQRCRQPLRVEDSLADLKPSSTDLLIGLYIGNNFLATDGISSHILLAPLEAEEKVKQHSNPSTPSSLSSDHRSEPISRRSTTVNKVNHTSFTGPATANLRPKEHYTAGPAESFVMLSRSQIAPPVVSQKPEDTYARNNSMSHRLKVANKLFDIMSAKSDIDHPMCQECTDILLDSLRRQLEDVSRERDCYIEFLKKVSDSKIDEAGEETLRKEIEEVRIWKLSDVWMK